MGVWEGNVRCM